MRASGIKRLTLMMSLSNQGQHYLFRDLLGDVAEDVLAAPVEQFVRGVLAKRGCVLNVAFPLCLVNTRAVRCENDAFERDRVAIDAGERRNRRAAGPIA